MASVDVKIVLVSAATILAYMTVANIIPQVESDLPPAVAIGADVTPEELVELGGQLYEGAGGCLACHSETPGARGPNLRTDYQGEGPIGMRCGERIPELDCKEYLYQALVRPQDHMIADYPPIMPPADRTLDQAQIWAIVAYLQSHGGEVTVTGDDIPDDPGAEPAAAPGEPAAAGVAATDPVELLRLECIQCHLYEGEGTDLGPALDGIGARRTSEEIRLAILDPPSVVDEGYEDFVGLMPTNFGERMTASQLEALVRYLSGLQ